MRCEQDKGTSTSLDTNTRVLEHPVAYKLTAVVFTESCFNVKASYGMHNQRTIGSEAASFPTSR